MTLNTWGMPEKLGSEFKAARMEAIGKEITKGTFDIYLLEELWMEPDHDIIANASKQANFSITAFRQLSPASCDGRVLPTCKDHNSYIRMGTDDNRYKCSFIMPIKLLIIEQ